jgi:hypothetical protein
MSFPGLQNARDGLNPQPMIAARNSVDGGVRVRVPFQEAVLWHSCGIVQLCRTIGSS